MSESINTKNDFENFIKEAIVEIKKHDDKEAYNFIMNAISSDPNRPEPQNLLGIWYELRGEDARARKHYRMAYVLDPIYRPASINLERVATIFPAKKIPIDFGERNEDEIPRPDTFISEKHSLI